MALIGVGRCAYSEKELVISPDPHMGMDAVQAKPKTNKHPPSIKTNTNAHPIINSIPLLEIKATFRITALTKSPFSSVYDFTH